MFESVCVWGGGQTRVEYQTAQKAPRDREEDPWWTPGPGQRPQKPWGI